MIEISRLPVDLNQLPKEIEKAHKFNTNLGYVLANAVRHSYEEEGGLSVLFETWELLYVDKYSNMMICTVRVSPSRRTGYPPEYEVERVMFTEESILRDIETCKKKLNTLTQAWHKKECLSETIRKHYA